MKTPSHRPIVSCCLLASLLAVTPVSAAVVDTFDGGGSPFVTTGTVGPTAGGPTGNFFRLTNAAGDNSGMLAYDTTDAGYYQTVTATFDFALRNGGGCCGGDADGLSFALLPTTLHGQTGVPAGFITEEANLVGGLGLGFDTFNNGPASADLDNNNHVSLHYNNVLLGNFNPGFELNSATFNRASLTLDFATRTASLTIIEDVNGAAIPRVVFTNQAVPGLTAYQSRAYFGGRTGGAFQNHDIDNVNVAYSQAIAYAESFDDGQANGGVMNGNAAVVGNRLRLTPNSGGQQGTFNIMDLNPGVAIAAFKADFEIAIGPGSGNPADGMSFVLGQLLDGSNYGEEGPGTGLVISADTYVNGESGETERAVEVIVNGVVVGHVAMNPFTNGTTVPVSVNFDADKTLDLFFGGTPIFTDLPTGYTPQIGDRFGFGARTGGETAEHAVDNINIQTTVPEPAGLALLGMSAVALLGTRRRRA